MTNGTCVWKELKSNIMVQLQPADSNLLVMCFVCGVGSCNFVLYIVKNLFEYMGNKSIYTVTADIDHRICKLV